MTEVSDIFSSCIDTPLGPMIVRATQRGICRLDFAAGAVDTRGANASDATRRKSVGEQYVLQLASEIDDYFQGSLRVFTVPVDLSGTVFQVRVWNALREIPYGTTISYTMLAGRLGDTAAVRAVANANARNPVSIVIPCHRVIGSDGSLTGYAGGLARKRRLLLLESSGAIEEPQADLFQS